MCLVNYQRNLITNLAEVTGSFKELLKKNNKWQCTKSYTKTLETLKRVICIGQVLAAFNEKLHSDIHCDACGDAVECCILQDSKPVSFASLVVWAVQTYNIHKLKNNFWQSHSYNRFHLQWSVCYNTHRSQATFVNHEQKHEYYKNQQAEKIKT